MHRPQTRTSVVAVSLATLVVAGTAAVAAAGVRGGEPAAAPRSAPAAGPVPAVGGSGSPAGDDPESAPRPPAPAVLVAGSGASTRLADRAGRTVYVTTLDAPRASRCLGACATTWQPVRSPGGKPQAGPGLQPQQVGSIQRPDGSQQVTVNGRPVYYFVHDTVPGDAKGEGAQSFGGRWSSRPDAAPPFPSAGGTQ